MRINFINQTNDDTKEFEKLIKSIFKQFKTKKIINIIFTNEDEIRRINKEYRNNDSVTDVISFANNDESDLIEIENIGEASLELGDIFICIKRAIEQAKEYNHSIKREVGFLAVHGYLHLLGYDHTTKVDEEKMFKKQEDILKKAGLERK